MIIHGMQVCTQAINSGSKRAICDAVGARALDVGMHVLDVFDEPGRRLGIAERRGQHVAQGGASARKRILTVVRQILHACDYRRMQDLQHDRGKAGLGDCRQVGVDLPGHAVGPDQSRIARRTSVDRGIVVTSRALLELGDDAAAQRVHRISLEGLLQITYQSYHYT